MLKPTYLFIMACLFSVFLFSCESSQESVTAICIEGKYSHVYEGKVVANHTFYAKSHYQSRIVEFEKSGILCNAVVMLGDSLTEKNDWFVHNIDISAQNRGISGDTSDGVLKRLDEIVISRPNIVFLLIGTNDLWTQNSAKDTADNIKAIVNTFNRSSPTTTVILQTVLPLRKDIQLNKKVTAINNFIRNSQTSDQVKVLDTYQMFVDSDGLLAEEYTYDGVHLNPRAYEIWEKSAHDFIVKLKDS